MPRIYTTNLLRGQTSPITDGQASSRGMGNTGSLSNLYDNNPYTFYDTKASAQPLSFTLTIPTQHIDTFYVIGENIASAQFTVLTPSSEQLAGATTANETFNNRSAVIFTGSSTINMTTGRLRITQSNSATQTKIYQMAVMRQLLDLTDNDGINTGRSITRFENTAGMRNAFIQEDLYGRRSLQTGHLSYPKKNINYTIWNRASNLTTCRQEVNQLHNIARQYPNITIFDLDESSTISNLTFTSQNYENVFQAFWVPSSFTESIEASNAISYSFSVEEQ